LVGKDIFLREQVSGDALKDTGRRTRVVAEVSMWRDSFGGGIGESRPGVATVSGSACWLCWQLFRSLPASKLDTEMN